MLCIRPFEKASENENKVESKGIVKISRLVSNYFYNVSDMENKVYKVLSELKLENSKEKFKGKKFRKSL